jgi:hypothetical protein
MPKRSCKVLLLSEEVQILDLMRKEKKIVGMVAKIHDKNKSFHEVLKEKEICAGFYFIPQLAKVITIVCGKWEKGIKL